MTTKQPIWQDTIDYYTAQINAINANAELSLAVYQAQVDAYLATIFPHNLEQPDMLKPSFNEKDMKDPETDLTQALAAVDQLNSEWKHVLDKRKADLGATPLDSQIGGNHYKSLSIQPIEALKAWLTPEEFRGWIKGSAISYIARERLKGGDQDLDKAAHILELFKSLRETPKS